VQQTQAENQGRGHGIFQYAFTSRATVEPHHYQCSTATITNPNT
jgi:hypothetical protein